MVTERGYHGYREGLPWLQRGVTMVTERGYHGYGEARGFTKS